MIRRHNKTIKFNQLFDWYFQCLSICFTLVANCFESQQTLIHTSIVVQIVKRKEKYRRNIHLQRKCFWFFRSTSVKKILISARNFPDSKVSFRLLFFWYFVHFLLYFAQNQPHMGFKFKLNFEVSKNLHGQREFSVLWLLDQRLAKKLKTKNNLPKLRRQRQHIRMIIISSSRHPILFIFPI